MQVLGTSMRTIDAAAAATSRRSWPRRSSRARRSARMQPAALPLSKEEPVRVARAAFVCARVAALRRLYAAFISVPGLPPRARRKLCGAAPVLLGQPRRCSLCVFCGAARAGSDRRGCFAGPSGAGRCGSRAPRAPRQRCVVASCAGPAACASRPLSAIVSKMTNSAIFPITFLVQKTPVELCWLQCASVWQQHTFL